MKSGWHPATRFSVPLSAQTARAIVLNARFGKRSFPWKSIRGIFFGNQAKSKNEKATVRFRSGPGVSADVLNGSLIRVTERELTLRHDLLGEVIIERTRLDAVYFTGNASKLKVSRGASSGAASNRNAVTLCSPLASGARITIGGEGRLATGIGAERETSTATVNKRCFQTVRGGLGNTQLAFAVLTLSYCKKGVAK